MSEWVSVADAARLVNRSPAAVYLWIRQSKLQPQRDNLGRMFLQASDVLRVESEQLRGRPRGSVTVRSINE